MTIRRGALVATGAVAIAATSVSALAYRPGAAAGRSRSAAGRRSVIWRENQKLGNWRWLAPAAPNGAIEGYGSQLSVVAGQTVELHVRTDPAAPYRVGVYRLGWYGGAGARLVACEPTCPGKRHGKNRQGRPRRTPPMDPTTGELAASWPVTDRIRTHRDWVSGEYLAQLVIARGRNRGLARWIPFVVRPAHPDPNSILVEVPVDTWEAYNDWGGKSLYDYNSSHGVAAVKVSFNRPWAYGDPNLTFPVGFEYSLLQFMERNGFPLEYATDVDIDEHPQLLLQHPLTIALGHGEYWSQGIRDAWDAARAAGKNLAILGADTGYWQIRYEDSHRTIVEYRSSTLDPEPIAWDKTDAFRSLDPPRPECQLEGVEFQSGGIYPPLLNSYTVVASGNPWLTAAGLKPGDVLPHAVRDEWDAVVPGCLTPAPTILLQYTGPYPADATVLQTPAGGRVFALGTDGFGGLVDGFRQIRCTVNVQAEKFLRAALIDLGRVAPGSLPPMPPACVKRPRR
jgi:hypothetical protein